MPTIRFRRDFRFLFDFNGRARRFIPMIIGLDLRRSRTDVIEVALETHRSDR